MKEYLWKYHNGKCIGMRDVREGEAPMLILAGVESDMRACGSERRYYAGNGQWYKSVPCSGTDCKICGGEAVYRVFKLYQGGDNGGQG